MLVSVSYRCMDFVMIHLPTFHSKLEQRSRKQMENSCGEDCFFAIVDFDTFNMHLLHLCNFNYTRRGYFSMSCCLLNLSIFAFFSSCIFSLVPSAQDALYPLHQHHLPPISAIFLSLSLSSTFGFSLRLLRLSPSAFSPSSRSNPRRRHQQTSWLYRESRLDYESWLEAGRLAHRCRREVPLFPFLLPFPRVLLLTLTLREFHSLFHSTTALPFRPPLSPTTFVTMESIRTLEAAW